MRKKRLFIRISLVLTLLLLVAAVMVGCGEKETLSGDTEYSFTFTAVFKDGSRETHEVTTKCDTVGAALLEMGLVAGEEGPYGLEVKSVCGVVADYDVDKTYWALYNGGEYSMVGVDSLKCADAEDVEFRVEQ